jgi:hypothetical protein
MRGLRTILVPLMAAALVAVPSTAGAASPPTTGAVRTAVRATTPVPRLVSVTAASHRGYDRVVWTFQGPLPSRRTVRYVPQLLGDASGLPIRLAGAATLQVTMSQAVAHTPAGTSTAARRLVVGLPNVIEIAQSGDFEAVVTYGVGLAKAQHYHLFTLTNPSRVVLDVRKDYPQVARTVSFLNLPRYAAGTPPYVRSQLRVVPSGAQASALLNQLMAGPTNAERARGLRLVRSGSADFTHLSITRTRVARLWLWGGCRSGGSTFTIADLIRPTLKRLAAVDYVKIFDPSGHTERPYGRSDSIPTCLEP